MTVRSFTLGFLSLVLFAGCSTRTQHEGLNPDPVVMVRQWTRPSQETPTVLTRGLDFSSPVLADNTLLFGSLGEGLVALYPSLNLVRWKISNLENGISSELLVSGGKVYFGASDGDLYCVLLENGRIEWKTPLRQSFFSKPTLDRGRLFITTAGDTVHAVDAGSGELIWTYRRKTSPSASIHGASSPLVDGEEVLVGLSDGYLVSLQKQDGNLKWEKKLHSGAKFVDVDARPILYQDLIYLPSYDGSLYSLRRKDGTTVWRFDAGGSQEPLVTESDIYLPSSDGSIYALDRKTAEVKWKFELDGGGVPTRVQSIEGRLFFGSSYQFFYVLDEVTGKPIYRWNVGRGSGFYGASTYDPVSRTLYMISSGGNLYSFLVRNPAKKVYPHAPGGGYTSVDEIKKSDF